MSEDFDKEAERKRLREKYEDEREDREATERMSELLLKGATMTNKHCDTCGSPIFRYQGQEFCPTCQEQRGTAGAEASPGSEASGQEPTTPPSQTAAEENSDVSAPGGRVASDDGVPPTDAPTETAAESAGEETQGTPIPPQSGHSHAAQGHAGDMDEARASLVRTLTTLARRAEQTDDPRQAKELLAAAREAAETLARLRGR